jgi:hypothetical protein
VWRPVIHELERDLPLCEVHLRHSKLYLTWRVPEGTMGSPAPPGRNQEPGRGRSGAEEPGPAGAIVAPDGAPTSAA